MSQYNEHDEDQHEHHILSNKTGLRVFLFLIIFTLITVITAKFTHFGSWNFLIAMVIATAKAAVVMAYFMGLKYDTVVNRIYFLSGFAFLGAFLILTGTDIWSRPTEMRVMGPVLQVTPGQGPTFNRPFEPSPEIVAHGKKLYKDNACYTCHGDNGVAVLAQARNFNKSDGWKNGRRTSDIVYTLEHGIPPLMNAFPTLSTTDKLALAHYVHTFNAEAPPADDVESLKRVGIDSTKDDGGLAGAVEVKETMPVDYAVERYLEK